MKIKTLVNLTHKTRQVQKVYLHTMNLFFGVAFSVLTCVALSDGFLHGRPEAGDDPQRAATATSMMRQLYTSAKKRADKIRRAEGRNESLSATDMLAMAVDYARDKVEHPPMLSVEKNLVMLNRNVRRLARELKRISRQCSAAASTTEDMQCRQCDEVVADSKLVPVQGKRYTIINKKRV